MRNLIMAVVMLFGMSPVALAIPANAATHCSWGTVIDENTGGRMKHLFCDGPTGRNNVVIFG